MATSNIPIPDTSQLPLQSAPNQFALENANLAMTPPPSSPPQFTPDESTADLQQNATASFLRPQEQYQPAMSESLGIPQGLGQSPYGQMKQILSQEADRNQRAMHSIKGMLTGVGSGLVGHMMNSFGMLTPGQQRDAAMGKLMQVNAAEQESQYKQSEIENSAFRRQMVSMTFPGEPGQPDVAMDVPIAHAGTAQMLIVREMENRRARAQAEAQRKPLDILYGLQGNAATDALRRGVAPMSDPAFIAIGNQIKAYNQEYGKVAGDEFAQFHQKFLRDNNLPDTAANELKAKTQWEATRPEKGPQPLRTMMLVRQPDGSQRLMEAGPGDVIPAGATTIAGAEKDVSAFNKAYIDPANQVEKSYQMMDQAYREYQAARAKGQDLPTGAQSMLALSQHLATTFGNVKGSRITKDMIQEHLGARSISDAALVAFQKLTNGDVLSPGQWTAFHDLIGQSRRLSWQGAEREAQRRNLPVDFLPPGVQTGGGKATKNDPLGIF